jgi:hypothetical protein
VILMGWRNDHYIWGPAEDHLRQARGELDGVESRPSREEIVPPSDAEVAASQRTIARWKAESCPEHYPVPSETCPACGERS